MKKFLLFGLIIISFQLSAQFTSKFSPNMLFKQASEFGYENDFPYWNVFSERQPDCTTRYELRGYTKEGERGLTLNLQSAQYCSTCDEMSCSYNGIEFILRLRVRNDEAFKN